MFKKKIAPNLKVDGIELLHLDLKKIHAQLQVVSMHVKTLYEAVQQVQKLSVEQIVIESQAPIIHGPKDTIK